MILFNYILAVSSHSEKFYREVVGMVQVVEAIRDKAVIEKMKRYLHNKSIRDYTLFVLGINSGLRVSDLLNLRVRDVASSSGKLHDRITLTEQKTGKKKDFPISDASRKALSELLSSSGEMTQDKPLFSSRKGNNPIKRGHAWRILKDAGKFAGIKDNIGTHTMRKTFGYHAYKKGLDLSLIQKLLNHSSPAITLSYIGITKEDMDNVYLNLNL